MSGEVSADGARAVREVPCYECGASVGDRCTQLPNYKRTRFVKDRPVPEHRLRRHLRLHIDYRMESEGLEVRG